MILVFYFVVGSHFGFLRLLFCSEFGGTLLDGFVFCREPFSTKSPVSTSAPNGQGDAICMLDYQRVASGKPTVCYGKLPEKSGICFFLNGLKLSCSMFCL